MSAQAPRMKACPHCHGLGQVAETFCDRVAHARLVQDLTQQQLADAVGISRPQIANIETGRTDASVPLLIGLSGALLVSIDWLVKGVESASTRVSTQEPGE